MNGYLTDEDGDEDVGFSRREQEDINGAVDELVEIYPNVPRHKLLNDVLHCWSTGPEVCCGYLVRQVQWHRGCPDEDS